MQPVRELSGSSQRSGHVREGAFPPSTIYSSTSDQPSTSSEGPRTDPIPIPAVQSGDEEEIPIRVVRQQSKSSVRSRTSVRSKSSWVSLRPQDTLSADGHSSTYSHDGDDDDDEERTRRFGRVKGHSPMRSGPATDDGHGNGGAARSLKSTLANFNLKRFSALPRTPSVGALSKRSRSSRGSERMVASASASRSPSRSADLAPGRMALEAASPVPWSGRNLQPSPNAVSPELPPLPKMERARPKIRSTWPEPMSFADVLAKKGALERSLGYAQKMQELSRYDAGLGDWIVALKTRGALFAPTAALRAAC
jgi:hypothetical protein